MTTDLDIVKAKIYHSANKNMPLTLCDNLHSIPVEDRVSVLQSVTEVEGQMCTPLLIAARNGCEKVVRVLLKHKLDLEQEGTIKFDGYIIEGASPLWCAAGAGHLGVVKMLVKAGADVNHPTKTNSTPLRAACFDGRLDVVKYLIDNKADIHITNRYNNNCLMIAAYKGRFTIVQYLLMMGANYDEKAHCGATALHFAAECGYVNIVEELMRYGAKITKNEHGITPLIAAAERNRALVVEYFINRPETLVHDKIDALELLGASFASDKESYDIHLAYKYLMQAMEERYKDPNNIIRKKTIDPIPAYEYRLECQTIEELEAIKDSPAQIHMEALTIRERILKSTNPEVPHPVIFRGAVFADNDRFDRCLELWTHALRLKLGKVSISKDLLRFAQVFSQMLHMGLPVEYDVIQEVFEATVGEVDRNQQKIACPGLKDEVATIQEELENNLITSLYLIRIMLRIVDLKKEDNNTQNTTIHHEKFTQMVCKLVRLKGRTRSEKTLLHLAVSPDTPVDDFHTNHICKFPCAATTKLLVNCGANVDDMDSSRNTPLHLIVPYSKSVSDFVTLHGIMTQLIDAGAHMDTVNCDGETPLESATAGVAEVILKTQMKLSLRCIASRVVHMYGIPYKNRIPRTLERFHELHGLSHLDDVIPGAMKVNKLFR